MKTSKLHAFALIEIMIVVAIIGILAAVCIPSFRRAIAEARERTCAIQRKNIDGVKVLWATATKQPFDANPTDADLFGKGAFMEHKPDCPAGGAYSLNAVEEKCTCSVRTHVNKL